MKRRTRKGREHFMVPDTQCKKGTPTDHLTAAGNYIVDKQPDVVIHIGDHWDMPSLSEYDKGKQSFEGRRYLDDIEAGKEGMEALMRPIWDHNIRLASYGIKPYTPELHFTTGNHEFRIERVLEWDPRLSGVIGYHHFELEKFGFKAHPFLKPVYKDGVAYAHYFYNPNTGRPYGGVMSTRLKNVGFSFTMGHQQGKDTAERFLANGKTIRGTVAGSFYQHDEEYKGYQGNHHWRGALYKHEVYQGDYDLMELSMNYLLDEWL